MPRDPAFQEALKACAETLNLPLPPLPGPAGAEAPQAAPDAPPKGRLDAAQRQQLDECLAGKGFEKPAGAPPPPRQRPPQE